MPITTAGQTLKRRRTKIVATIGPASSDPAIIDAMIDAGVDVFRLNMSHGDHDTHRRSFTWIREAAAKRGLPIAILADLSGPKIRCGMFEKGQIELEDGQTVTVTTRDVEGHDGLIPSQYEALATDVSPGDPILLDDGNLELHVDQVDQTEITATVIHGGILKNRKGMNLPGVRVSAPSLTEKDRVDARFALDLGVEYLALSFVRRTSDVVELRELVHESGKSVSIISKIEKPEALEEIEGILEASDGVMVARGDLGVELPAEKIPSIQSQLVDLARSRARPVIVATQMLESMIANARPTRAEVSDVSTAVMSGADAVMLSAETAAGAFPVRAVETMDRIARETEGVIWRRSAFGSFFDESGGGGSPFEIREPTPLSRAIARATAQLSRDLLVRAILIISEGGTTARMVSAARPASPLLAVSPSFASCRTMNLLWGVVPICVDERELVRPNAMVRQLVRDFDLGNPGEYVLRVSGFHQDPQQSIPTISVISL